MEQEASHFRSIVESSDDAIISKSLDSVVTSWNAGAQAMFGYSAEEMLGRPITVLLPPDRLNEEELILQRLRAGEKVDHFETLRIRKDGRAVHVSVTISPIHDADGKVVGASKIARDIGEKKALEAQLLLTASVFSHTREGILVIGTDGVIMEVNPAFTQITGYGRDEVLVLGRGVGRQLGHGRPARGRGRGLLPPGERQQVQEQEGVTLEDGENAGHGDLRFAIYDLRGDGWLQYPTAGVKGSSGAGR